MPGGWTDDFRRIVCGICGIRLSGMPRKRAPSASKKRVPMIGRVEPHLLGSQGRGHVCQREVQIAPVVVADRVGELVLVEVDDRGQPPHGIADQPEKLGQIEHVGGEQDVPLPAGGLLLAGQFGERDRRVPHPPLPFVRRQREQGPVMPAVGDPAIEQRLMTAAVVWFQGQDIHRVSDLLSECVP